MLTFHSWFLPTFHSPPPPLVRPTSCQTWMNVEAGLFLSPRAHQCTDKRNQDFQYGVKSSIAVLHASACRAIFPPPYGSSSSVTTQFGTLKSSVTVSKVRFSPSKFFLYLSRLSSWSFQKCSFCRKILCFHGYRYAFLWRLQVDNLPSQFWCWRFADLKNYLIEMFWSFTE